MGALIAIARCIAVCFLCCDEVSRRDVVCCEAGCLSSCCKECWCCECREQCCASCSASQVQLLRVFIFAILACGMIVAGLLLLEKSWGWYNEAKEWEVEKMSCGELCGDKFYEKVGDVEKCCYLVGEVENCDESKYDCQNMRQISMIVAMSLCGLMVAVGGWMSILLLRSICKVCTLLRKPGQNGSLQYKNTNSMLDSEQSSFNGTDGLIDSKGVKKGFSSNSVSGMKRKDKCNHTYYDTVMRERVRYQNNCPFCR